MPPRAKKQKVEEEEDEALFDSDASLAEEDVAPKRGRGKKAPAAKGKPKGKKAGAAGGDGAGLEIDEEVQASPRKRAPKVTEEMVDEHGWTLIPPGLMFKCVCRAAALGHRTLGLHGAWHWGRGDMTGQARDTDQVWR